MHVVLSQVGIILKCPVQDINSALSEPAIGKFIFYINRSQFQTYIQVNHCGFI